MTTVIPGDGSAENRLPRTRGTAPAAAGPTSARVAASFLEQVPFHAKLRLQVQESCLGRGVVVLPAAPDLVNHVGSAHAGALFTLADAAAGAAVVPLLLDRADPVDVTVRAAEVRYLAPGHGTLTATATFGGGTSPDQVAHDLRTAGRLELEVMVDLHDEQRTTIATVVLHWRLRQRQRG